MQKKSSFNSPVRITVLFFFLLNQLYASAQVNEVPDFSLNRMDNGKSFTKADMYRGKKSLFIFFSPECGHCQDAIKTFEANNHTLDKVAIYLVTMENKATADQFLSIYAPVIGRKINMTLLQDRNGVFVGKFMPRKFPSMFLFGPDQKLIRYSDEEHDIPNILKAIGNK